VIVYFFIYLHAEYDNVKTNYTENRNERVTQIKYKTKE
jgi:hypothetical protein